MCRYWPNWPESLYEGVDEVYAGELHERGEYWREAQDDVGVQGSRVSNLNRRIKKNKTRSSEQNQGKTNKKICVFLVVKPLRLPLTP